MAEHGRSRRETRVVDRRALILAGATGIATVSGCVDPRSGGSEPQERTFEVRIRRSDGALVGSVPEAGEDGVVRVYEGDTAAFRFRNETADGVAVHEHASDTAVVVDAGGERTIEFEVTAAMVGRQEIEAWAPEEGPDDGAGDGHGTDATTILVVEVRPRGS